MATQVEPTIAYSQFVDYPLNSRDICGDELVSAETLRNLYSYMLKCRTVEERNRLSACRR